MKSFRRQTLLKRSMNQQLDMKWAADAFKAQTMAELLEGTVVNAARLFDSPICVLMLVEGDHLTVQAAKGVSPEAIGNRQIPLGRGISGRLIKLGQPRFLPDVDDFARSLKDSIEPYYTGAMVLVPLVFNKQVIGLINLCRPAPLTPFSMDEFQRMTAFGDMTAFAITSRSKIDDQTRQLCAARDELEDLNQRLEFLVNQRTKELTLANRQLEQQVIQRKRSEMQYRMLIDQMREGVVIAQGDPPRLLFANPAMQTITGYPTEKLTALSPEAVVNLVHPDDQQVFFDRFRGQLEDGGAPISEECRGVRNDGSVVWVAVSAGRTVYQQEPAVLAVFTDITERKQSEAALRTSHERFLTVLNSIDATIYVADMDTYEILFMNQKMIDAFGRDMTGEVCWQVFRNESKPCRNCSMTRIVDGSGKPTGVDVWHDRNPITGKWYLNYDRAIDWIDGRRVKIQIATDITEIKEMEAKIRQTQKMDSLGTLAGGIAHDFNNILAAIIGFSELALEEVEKGTNIEDCLQEAYTAAKRAKDLVRQILAFARQSEERISPIQLSTITKEVLKFIRSTVPASIEIRQRINSKALIMGNATQIHQVLMNLCTNAIQAMTDENGVIEVALETCGSEDIPDGLRKKSLQKHFVRLTVADNGPGIAPEILDSIFNPYFTTKRQGEGTGMGLAVVHGIVEGYGGEISVASRPGHGTAFTVVLPATGRRPPRKIHALKSLPHGTEKILFVDDEAAIVKMGQRILEGLGYSVTTRTSSVEALELFRSKPGFFDLVITDMTMPNMTGDALAAKMIDIRPDIPMVLCTGYSKKISQAIARERGFKAFAYKPIVRSELATTVRKVLDEVAVPKHAVIEN